MISCRDLIVPLLFVLGALATGCAHSGHPHPHHKPGFPQLLNVSGEGEASAAPDIARTNVGVETRAASAAQATADAAQRMASVLDALKKAGVPEADLRTHSLSLRFERDHDRPVEGRAAPGAATASAPAQPATPAGSYVARNMVEVTVRDLSRVSDVLGAATAAGADQMWGIQFEVEDTEPLVAKARELAVQRAERNAKQLAELTHVQLGEVVSVGDGGGAAPGPMPMMATRAVAESAPRNMPVEGGQLTVSHQVTITYRLK